MRPFLLLFVALIATNAINSWAADASLDLRAEIITVDRQRTDVLLNNDFKTLSRLTSPQAIHITTSGVRRTGEAWLNNRKNATVPFVRFVLNNDQTVRVFGDVVIIEGSYFNTKKVNGKETQPKYARYTRAYQKFNQGWQMITHQATSIKQ